MWTSYNPINDLTCANYSVSKPEKENCIFVPIYLINFTNFETKMISRKNNDILINEIYTITWKIYGWKQVLQNQTQLLSSSDSGDQS